MSAVPLRRKSSLAAEKRLRSQLENVEDNKEKQRNFICKFKKHKSNEESDFEDKGSSDQEEEPDRKSTRLNSSHSGESRMPSSA